MDQRLSLVTLGVADLSRAVAFYEGIGWTRAMQAAEGVAFFQLGGIGLSLYPEEELALDAGLLPRGREGFRGISLAYNVRERDHVDAIVEKLTALGGTVSKPPEDKFWGGYGAYVLDPDGHAWEIAWNPAFPIGEGGAITLPR